ncbi:MAG: aminopeptidase P family protein [Proteobacteria bacterium]|nr:aminopeptidase P family protein [Pseudomonadota bacterium]
MTIFTKDTLNERRRRAAASLGPDTPLVVIAAGEPIQKPSGLDQVYPFVPFAEYYWLTGSQRPGGIITYDHQSGWTDFVRPASTDERLWEGEPEVPPGEDVAGFAEWLKAQTGSIAAVGAKVEGVEADKEASELAQSRLDISRRAKDEAELELIGRAVNGTARGFAHVRDQIRPGVNERFLQIELESTMYRHGCDGVGFGTIVGAGTHSAVLHFEPGERVVGDDDLVLVDAGGSILGYTADVSRTYSAKGKFTHEQQAIYDIVLAAQLASIDKCRVGVEWADVHRTAAATLAQGLVDLGILKGKIDDLLDSEAISLFFPHGVGHMLGLGVRDVGGRAVGRELRKVCGARLRVDLPLEQHFLMTIEPGLYFVPAIIDSAENQQKFADAVAWDSLDRWRPVGGVRIEDDILVTADEPKNLTQAIEK